MKPKLSISLKNARELFGKIADSQNAPDYIIFLGMKYKLGSKKLQNAIDEWQKENNIKTI